MDVTLITLLLIHSNALALGVGSSTIAIAGFLTAIGDGKFDDSERRIMGVVYLSLRIAMVAITITSALIVFLYPGYFGWFNIPMWIMIAVLFLNAYLMTKHWISPKLGPAIQAGTWYSFGFIITLFAFELAEQNLQEFFTFFATDLVAAILIVNACMLYLNARRKRKK